MAHRNRLRRSVSAIVLGCGLLLECGLASAGLITLLRDNLNGIDTATNRTDLLRVRLTGPGDTVHVQTLASPVDFGAGTFISSFFDVFVDLNPATLSPGQYQLQFRLDEDSNGNGQTNTAVGLDRIRITAEIPEPATLPLLAAGLGGLVALRGRKALWAARIF